MIGYIPGLGGIRALAILMIVGFNAQMGAFTGGFLGIEVFLVITGYIATHRLLPRNGGPVDLDRAGGFVMARLLRLWPLLFLVCATVIGIEMILGLDDPLVDFLTHDFSDSALPMQASALGHGWLIMLLTQFYIALAMLLVLLGGAYLRQAGLIFAALWCLTTGFRLLATPDLEIYPMTAYPPAYRGSGLLFGAALAFLNWTPGRLYWVPAAVGSGLLAVVFAAAQITQDSLLAIWIPVTEIATACLLFAVLAQPRQNILTALLSLPALRQLGAAAFAIYLWHYPIALMLRPHLPVWGTTLIALFGSLAIAMVLHGRLGGIIESKLRRQAARRSGQEI